MNYGKLLGMIAGTGAGLASMPEDAEASIRSDIANVVSNAILGKKYRGAPAGTLDSIKAQKQLLDDGSKYKSNKGYLTDHELTQRNIKDGWDSGKIANAHTSIYNSPETVVVPNVLGVDPVAKEALWTNIGNNKSFYMPIRPKKKGFEGVTIYDPEANKVERLLKERGYWKDGEDSSFIFTPSLYRSEPVQPVGSGPLSAVSNTLLGEELVEAMNKGKKVLPPAIIATGIPTQTDANIPSGDEYGWPIRRGFTIDEPGIKEAYAPWDIAFDLYGGGAAAKVVNVAASLAAENIPQGLLDVITFYSEQE